MRERERERKRGSARVFVVGVVAAFFLSSAAQEFSKKRRNQKIKNIFAGGSQRERGIHRDTSERASLE
jgi:hypothetical protein